MINVVTMTERQKSELRKTCLRSLFCFCRAVMGYDEISEGLHGEFCSFLEGAEPRKQVTMPRSFVKTWISSIAYPIWVTLPRHEADEFPDGVDPKDPFYNKGPNMRILIASYVISNAEKMVGLIRKTYEVNSVMQMFFSEVIPENFNKTKWSNQAACINRPDEFTEQTFEAAGIGGSSTSRHYDLIIEDDLIYASKDDFSGQELQPNQEDIDKAIGWHKLATSLLVPGRHTRIHNTGTRWAKRDLVDYIWRNEPQYAKFVRGAVVLSELEEHEGDWRECTPTWPVIYDISQLQMIRDAQGPWMFATQYLLQPSSPEEKLFNIKDLQYYKTPDEIPKDVRVYTTVDLSSWTAPTRKSACRGVVLTAAWCPKNHLWVKHYDIGRFTPSEIIYLIEKHWKMYHPEMIVVEDIYYQKALAYFAREYMNEGKIERMSIRGIKPENNVGKDIRIAGLEPYIATQSVHCRVEHKELIEEVEDYIPNSKLCKKDILDTLAYQRQVGRPGAPQIVEVKRDHKNYKYKTNMDEVLEKMLKPEKKGPFGEQVLKDPYADKDDMLIGVTDPFYVEEDY